MAKASTARVRSTRNQGAGRNQLTRVNPRTIQKRQEMAVRLGDALLETLGGMGTDKDKLANTTYQFVEFDAAQASMAYRSDWIARKIVDIPAWDSTREWRSWQADDDDITMLEDEEERLNVQLKVMQAQIKARLFGGAALVLGVNQGSTDQPLDYTQIKKGDLQFLHVVSRWELGEDQIEYDLASPWYGEPKFYTRNSQVSAGVRFHPSRIIPFVGAERQEGFEAKSVWGDSVLQITMDAVKAAGLVTNSAAQLIAEAKIDIIKIPGLSENISTKKYEDNLKTRFGVANLIKSVYSMLLIDKEEEWERQNAQFTGLADLLNLYMLLSCGAADIPATRFLGQSPAGMNATGESDIRNYYDATKSKQKLLLGPRMNRLDSVLIPSTFGTTPEEIFYLWNPLWQMSEKERSEIAKQKAETVKLDADMGLIEPMVLKHARQNQLIEDAFYPGLESIIDEFDAEDTDPGEAALPVGPDGQPLQPGEPGAEGEGLPPPAVNENEPVVPARRAAPADARAKRKAKRGHRAGTYGSIATAFRDAQPRSLYVYRPVLNSGAILQWAKEQGFQSALLAEDLHVTITYSKQPVDWLKMGDDRWGEDDTGNMTIKPGGPRLMEQFGDVQVLVFGSSALSYRHEHMKYAGASCDYEDFNPHISITYRGDILHLPNVEPYQGEIVLGPEVFKEIKGSFNDPQEMSLVDGKTIEGKVKVKDEEAVAATDAARLAALIGEAIGKIPAPIVQVTVPDAAPPPPRKPRRTTTKVKHDERGRILETETTEHED